MRATAPLFLAAIVLLAVLGTGCGTAGEEGTAHPEPTTPGQGEEATPGTTGTVFGIDADPSAAPANTATSLGTIESCIQVESIDSGPGVPGPSFDIDVFLDDVPNGKNLAGVDFFMYYDRDYLQVNGWAGPTGLGCSDWLLGTQAGSDMCFEAGQTTFPDTDGTLNVAIVDLAGAAGAELPGARGVLNRYVLEIVQAGPKVVAITFAGCPTYLAPSAGARYDPDQVLGATIAIDQPCPESTPGR